MAKNRERGQAEQSQAGNPPAEQPNAAVAETNGTAATAETAATKRRKRKGARTVFYMAVKPLAGTNVVREVTRADTHHQLGQKLKVLREVSDEFADGVYILQCRPA